MKTFAYVSLKRYQILTIHYKLSIFYKTLAIGFKKCYNGKY